MEEEKKTILVTKVELGGLSRHGIRLTELGGALLTNGSVVRVPVTMAKDLVERFPENCKIQGAKSPYDFPSEVAPVDFKPEIVGKAEPKLVEKKAESPVATEKAKGPATEGKPSNKNVAKAPATKG